MRAPVTKHICTCASADRAHMLTRNKNDCWCLNIAIGQLTSVHSIGRHKDNIGRQIWQPVYSLLSKLLSMIHNHVTDFNT